MHRVGFFGNHGRMNEWNDIAVLTPPGDIDIATVPALRRRLDALIGRGVRRVVINCQAVSFIDSTGLAFLLTRARELMRREGLLSLVNASGEVVRFLEIARLVDILHVAGPARESIPAIPVGELPRWSKSVEVRQGIDIASPNSLNRFRCVVTSATMSHWRRGRRWVMPMTMRAVSGAS